MLLFVSEGWGWIETKRARVEIDQDYCAQGGDLFAAATSTPVRSGKEELPD